jgi:hypothetical protein
MMSAWRVPYVCWFAACLLASTAAQAKEARVQPEGMPVKPGQYTSFLDWVSKQHFTKAGTPNDVVDNYVQCTYRVWYNLSTPTERDVIDQAARGDGMNPGAFNAYFRDVAGRFAPWAAQARVMKACKPEGDRYIQFMYSGND